MKYIIYVKYIVKYEFHIILYITNFTHMKYEV